MMQVRDNSASGEITQREAAFRLALLAAIVDSSDDAIVSKTLEGRILSWNQGATRIFGYSAEEVIGRHITLLIPTELHAEEQQILDKLKRGERIDHFDTTRITKDGRRIPISLTVSPVRDENGAIVGASKIARDISERKQFEQALRDADRRKDDFLAQLAHELRNPLAPIRYALAASRKAGTLEVAQRAQETIERQVAHMSRLLEDLLDVSRITSGRLELKKEDTDLSQVLRNSVETARPLINDKRHEISVNIPPRELRIHADPVRLTQVFSNLLINAAKYTDPGGRIALQAEQESNAITVSVRDTGIGISEDLMPRLFDLYSQGGDATGRSQGGLGIGLSLVRGLVTLHGGSVEVHSRGPGQGSEFTVRLPV